MTRSKTAPTNIAHSALQLGRDRLLQTLLVASSILLILIILSQGYAFLNGGDNLSTLISSFITGGVIWSLTFLRRLPYTLRAAATVGIVYLGSSFGLLSNGYVGSGRIGLLITPFLGLILLSSTTGIIMLILSVLAVSFVGWQLNIGGLQLVAADLQAYIDGSNWALAAASTLATAVVGIVAFRTIIGEASRALVREQELEQELKKEGELLENRVRSRIQALKLSTEISHHISNILNPDELMTAVVEQLQKTLDYYHVQIYLLHDLRQKLYLKTSATRSGIQMPAHDHEIALGHGPIGRAVVEDRTILLADVSKSKNWSTNEHFPHTKAELAVPIRLESQILGILDVQQDYTDGLDQDDVYLLETIASQLAVALQNARIYAQTQQQAERETILNEINQKIQNTTTMQEALHIAARELAHVLGATQLHVEVGVTDKASQT